VRVRVSQPRRGPHLVRVMVRVGARLSQPRHRPHLVRARVGARVGAKRWGSG
jgi:hypothetical protein